MQKGVSSAGRTGIQKAINPAVNILVLFLVTGNVLVCERLTDFENFEGL